MSLSFKIFKWTFIFLFLSSVAFSKKAVIREWEKDGCDLIKEDLKLSPQVLFEEFIKRDSDGEFLRSSPWLNKAVECPGYMGGPDVFYVISSKKIKALGKNIFRVTYAIEGRVEVKQLNDKLYSVFISEKNDVIEDYRTIKTPWGWKLASPWSVSRIPIQKVLELVENGNQPFDQKSKELISKTKTK